MIFDSFEDGNQTLHYATYVTSATYACSLDFTRYTNCKDPSLGMTYVSFQ